ncbi:glutamate receptor ionotropic, kainate 2 [Eurytemora carolleeae]|uniref:glutamate receptor ionotropic, kainate 2 n=1 Tax=Eurytemora carolleeae TaxID=1294199 RepID=UPI000C7750DF|nr:glutamate receptor ionotropic, kainate 2 [Eurytemora carolleeae]|eukprot:XP_023334364.1 glutamate receptor ionotropic, kainate 2-like [Eurytemora affinis]
MLIADKKMWQQLMCLIVSCNYNNKLHILSDRLDDVHVTTVLNPPFVALKPNSEKMIGNDKYEGFVPDMLKKLTQILGVNFSINLVKDGKYGKCNHGNCTGMIGEVKRGKADLAIADITISPLRVLNVDFSQPFMTGGITTLVKNPEPNIRTVEDLIANGYRFLSYCCGSTERFFRTSKVSLHERIANNLVKVDSNSEGVDRVLNSDEKLAMLIEESSAKWHASQDCSLKVVGESMNSVGYGIGMAKGIAVKTAEGVFEVRTLIDHAILQMKYDSTLELLESKWWPKKC